MPQPILYIIAGCNGAGKTTASMTVLPAILDCQEFVNADEIAKGLSPFKPEEMAIEAGRLMLERISSLMKKKATFAIETTLATKSYRNLVLQAQREGYKVVLLYFWLPSPEMAEQRVASRVAAGGHNIAHEVIHRRYWLGLRNLFEIFAPIVDLWSLYDNTNGLKTIVNNTVVVKSCFAYTNQRIMSEQEKLEFGDRIVAGIRQAQRALFERKAKLGEPVVVADEHGLPIYITGEEALRRLDELEASEKC